MKQSSFIKEMSELEDKILDKGNVLKFAELSTEVDDVCGEIEGFLFLLEERARLLKIDDRFGFLTIYSGLDFLNGSPEEIEKNRKDPENSIVMERAEIVIRLADSMKPFNGKTWTPEIKAKFEEGLKYLEGLIKGDKLL